MRYDGSMLFKKDNYNGLTVEGEWLNGVPHGICIIDGNEVRGVMTFVHGKIKGPYWMENK